jgi:CubicO group peptidase (beta-lactamase class C family)
MEYDALFSIDSKKSGLEYMPSRLIARAIDYARFGSLMLHEGAWNGRQIISKDWVLESTRENTSIPRNVYPGWWGDDRKRLYYNYQWWGHANCDSTYQFSASGNLGQNIYVIPDQEIVIVHCGNSLKHYGDFDLWEVAENINSK